MIFLSYAENAVAAKVKAIYGKRITSENYRQLLGKKTVGEVAAYLKSETSYKAALDEVKEELIHRGQLENMVHKRGVDLQLRLLKFGTADTLFSQLFVKRMEIDQLLLVMRMLSSGNMEQYIITFPAYLNRYLSFDLFSLAKIKTYDDLLDLVKGSAYYQILGSNRPISNVRSLDVAACEAALMNHYYADAFAMVKKNYKNDTRETLLHILQAEIDLYNLVAIYRMKQYFSMSTQEIFPLLIHEKGTLHKNLFQKFSSAETPEEMVAILHQDSQLKHYIDNSPEDMRLEWTLKEAQLHFSRKMFRFSTQPAVILFSFLTLLEFEMTNIINIIEGIRYELPPDEIYKLLII